jgi:hypothetical protein
VKNLVYRSENFVFRRETKFFGENPSFSTKKLGFSIEKLAFSTYWTLSIPVGCPSRDISFTPLQFKFRSEGMEGLMSNKSQNKQFLVKKLGFSIEKTTWILAEKLGFSPKNLDSRQKTWFLGEKTSFSIDKPSFSL